VCKREKEKGKEKGRKRERVCVCLCVNVCVFVCARARAVCARAQGAHALRHNLLDKSAKCDTRESLYVKPCNILLLCRACVRVCGCGRASVVASEC